MTTPLTEVREISRIGYGFIASKALFAALDLDLFGRLAAGPRTIDELAPEIGVAANRLTTLATALVSVGLLEKRGESYANAPASAAYLVSGRPLYYGDYFRYQIARQIYPLLLDLGRALEGKGRVGGAGDYESWLARPDEARLFSHSQHVGSLGPANRLAKQVDFAGRRRLLDVAGGTGAFAIALCRRNPELTATILDFPRVVELATPYLAEAGLEGRIARLGGNALIEDWPGGQDAVLMSYLQSAVADAEISELDRRAFEALEPGGLVLIHDFMVDDARTGPPVAAWFLLVSLSFNPGTVCLTPGLVGERLERAGFERIEASELIPGITRLVVARKPARPPGRAGPRG